MPNANVHVCTFRHEPGETECYTAICSQGRACKTCTDQCYRVGWDKWRVDCDNKRLVKENNA